jgi:hypothetical protein
MKTLVQIAKELQEAQAACEEAFRKVYNDAPLMEPDHFWELMDLVRKEIRGYRFGLGRTNGVKQGAEEVGRKIWTDQVPKGLTCTAEEYVSFAKTYSELARKFYDPLFHVAEGYGDDSYGDLLDTLPLLGRDFSKRILDGEWKKGDHKKFMAAIAEVVENQWVWKDDTQNRGPAMVRFFQHSEEYVRGAVQDAAKQCLFRVLAEQEEVDHSFV